MALLFFGHHTTTKETHKMKTKENIKTILAIIFSLFMGNELIMLLGLLFPKQIHAILPSNANIRSFIVELIGALISVGLIFLFRKTHVLKISGKGMKEGLICGVPLIILYSLVLLLGLSEIPGKTLIPAVEIALIFIRFILIGVAEEGLFRGVIQELFMDIFGKNTRKGILLSIVFASTLFGLNHFQNLIAGVNLLIVLVQVASAIASGLLFGAIAFRSGRIIWPMVLIHALIDASGFVYGGMLWGVSDVDSINSLDPRSLIMIPIFVGIYIFLMRKSKTESVVNEGISAEALV